MNSKKIHIISNQRSGSTWYQQVLSYDKINVKSFEFEPFNKNAIRDNFKPSIEESINYFYAKERCVIKNQFERLLQFDKDTFNYLINLPEFKRVILLRKDRFEQTLSHVLAIQTGEWQNTDLKDPIVIDFNLWKESLDFIRTYHSKLKAFALKNNDQIVWYEDIKSNKKTDRIKNPDKKFFIENIQELKEDYNLQVVANAKMGAYFKYPST